MIIGFTASCFDLGPHAGHVAMLKEAKVHCGHLIIGLHVDPSKERTHKNKPVQSVAERYLMLKACRYVDEIIPYETESDLLELIKLLQPDIRFLGEEYKGCEFTGRDMNIKIHYCKRNHNVSSSNIRKKIIRQFKESINDPE